MSAVSSTHQAPKMARLPQICRIANHETFLLEGTRLTSAALCHVLPQLGFTARPLRIRAAIHHPSDPRQCGVVLGSDGDGERLPKAKRDCWHGHLAVLVDERYLLDATIDQVDGEHGWIKISEPFVGEVSQRFLTGEESLHVKHGNTDVNYRVAPRQVGFRSAPDWKYRSHFMPLALRILEELAK